MNSTERKAQSDSVGSVSQNFLELGSSSSYAESSLMRVMSQNNANGSKICVIAIMITLVALRTRSKWNAVLRGFGFGWC